MQRVQMLLLALPLLLLLLLDSCRQCSAAGTTCQGLQASDITMENSRIRLQKLRKHLSGCEYVIGSLYMSRIHDEFFEDDPESLDFSFLDSIREVTGCVQILKVCVKKPLMFRNLRIIHGRGCSNNSLFVDETCDISPHPVSFPMLRHIDRGNVVISNPFGCYMQKLVNFSDILQSPKRQNVSVIGRECVSVSNACHSECPKWPDGRQHCWGPGKDECQSRSKCSSRTDCSHCYVDAAGDEKCCSDLCLGGCNGRTASDCYGCTRFSNNGTCVANCRRSSSYDATIGRLVPSTGPKLMPLGPVCVAECPPSYFVQDDTCVSKCLDGFSAAADSNLCVKAESMRVCEQQKNTNTLVCYKGNLLLDGLTNSSLLCTEFHGRITINENCFSNSNVIGLTTLTRSDLFRVFSRLRKIHGSIQVSGRFGLNNLSFLSQLTSVSQKPGKSSSGNLIVVSDSIEYLGLTSLTRVAGNFVVRSSPVQGKTSVSYCPNLFPTNATFTDGIVRVDKAVGQLLTFMEKFRTASNCSLNQKCDSQCHPDYGCWGPGPSNCVLCRAVRTGNACAASCDTVPGWYDSNRTDSRGQRVCSRCHELCSRCTGPGKFDCVECAAHAYRDGANCVRACSPRSQFADSSRVCRPCPSVCMDLHNGRPTCSGDSAIVGDGGCQFCTRIVQVKKSALDSTMVVKCIQHDSGCPAGFRATVFDNTDAVSLPEFADRMRKSKITASICKPCPSKCQSCNSEAACTSCRFYTVESDDGRLRCADSQSPACPTEHYAVPKEKVCRRCPRYCATCDSGRCTQCAPSAFTHFDGGNGTFVCVSECPSTHPHSNFNKKLGFVCSSKLFDSKVSPPQAAQLDVATVFTLVGVAIAVLVVVMVCCVVVFRLKRRDTRQAEPLRLIELKDEE